GARQRSIERVVREPKGGCGVGAATAEAGGDGDLLLDRRRPGGRYARGLREERQRSGDERVLREALDAKLRPRLERGPGGEAEPLQHGRPLVLARPVDGADDESEVDLGSGDERGHGSSAASFTNSSGATDSARALTGNPSAASASAACPRDATLASSTEFGR